MRRPGSPQPLPTATDLAHAPELAILIALDTVLKMTAVTIHLVLPELDILQGSRQLLDPELQDRDLVVAQDLLDLIDALSSTIRRYRNLSLQS